MSDQLKISRIELKMFKIEQSHLHSDRGGTGISYRPGRGTEQYRLALRIVAEDGVVGEYVPPRGRAKVIFAAVEALAYGLLGEPALQRERLYLKMRRATKHVGEVGIGALDIALWDLAGRYHQTSVASLLGGHRRRLPAYASTLHGDDCPDGLSSPEAYADFAERCGELGYRAFKIHGFHAGDPDREAAILHAVATRVGDRMRLMYDASCHLPTFAAAVRLGRVCDALGFEWFEDPYADGGVSIHGHQRLKAHIETPIMIGEHIRNPETMTDMLVNGASDYCRIDPDYDGGITGCYKAALAAQSLGMDAEVHSCGPAMRQLMAALSNSSYYEINLLHPVAGNPWHLPVYADEYSDELDAIDTDGCVEVPGGLGLGVAYDWPRINQNSVENRLIEL